MTTAIIGRYEPLRLLGSGGMSRVYLVKDHISDQAMALKTLHQGAELKWDSLRYEFHVLSCLRDPYLIEVYDLYNLQAKGAFFTMEYIEGGNLDQFCEQLPLSQRISLLLKITRALHTLHQIGILHLDIKASNVRVRNSNQDPVLMDFGLAQFISDKGKESVRGTLHYMAPEMLTQEKPVGRHTDIFSLGVLFYRVLTGTLPYRIHNAMSLLYLVHKREFPQPVEQNRHIPKKLNALILDMLSYAPAQRPRDQDVLTRLEACLQPGTQAQIKPAHGRFLFAARFIGDTATTRLEALSRQVAAGSRPRMLLFSGERGTGKSRLLALAKQTLQTEGLATLEARCFKVLEGHYRFVLEILFQLQGILSYWLNAGRSEAPAPLSSIHIASGDTTKPAAPKRETVPPTQTIETLEKPTPPSAGANDRRQPLAPQTAQDFLQRTEDLITAYDNPEMQESSLLLGKSQSIKDLFYATFRLLTDVSRCLPFVILMDDIDRDHSTQDFLHFYFSFQHNTSDPMHFGVIATARSIPINRNRIQNIPVTYLTMEQTRDLVESVLANQAPAAFVEFLHGQTKGEASLIKACMHYFYQHDAICWRGSHWAVATDWQEHVLRLSNSEVLQGNLDKLSHLERSILTLLALAGAPLDYRIIQYALNQPIKACLADLESKGFITYSYSYPLYRAYYLDNEQYGSLLCNQATQARHALLQALVNALLHYVHTLQVNPVMVAELAFRAKAYAIAYLFAKRRAMLLLQNYAFQSALHLLNMALYSLKQLPAVVPGKHDLRLARLYLMYVSWNVMQSRYGIMQRWLDKIQSKNKLLGSRSIDRDCLFYRTKYLTATGRYRQAGQVYSRLLAVSRTCDREDYIKVLFNYANLSYHMGNLRTWKHQLDSLAEPIRQVSKPLFSAMYHVNQGLYSVQRHDYKHAAACLDKAMELALRLGDLNLLALCHYNLARLRTSQNKGEASREHLLQALGYYKKMNYPQGMLMTYHFLAQNLFAGKDMHACYHYAAKCLRMNLQYRYNRYYLLYPFEFILFALANDLSLMQRAREIAFIEARSAHMPHIAAFWQVTVRLNTLYLLYIFAAPQAHITRECNQLNGLLQTAAITQDRQFSAFYRPLCQMARMCSYTEEITSTGWAGIQETLEEISGFHRQLWRVIIARICCAQARWDLLAAIMPKRNGKTGDFLKYISPFFRLYAAAHQGKASASQLDAAFRALWQHDVWLFRLAAGLASGRKGDAAWRCPPGCLQQLRSQLELNAPPEWQELIV